MFKPNVSPLSVFTKHLFLAPVASNFLLTTDIQIKGIYQINLENKNISAVDVLAGNPNIPDYDNVRRKLVWWDKSKNTIMESSLYGTDGKAVKGIKYYNRQGVMDLLNEKSHLPMSDPH